MRMRRTLPALIFLGLTTLPLPAQTPGGLLVPQDSTLIDRVLAVVGDSVVLLTDVQSEYALARNQNVDVTPEQILENLINLQLILQEAARDSTVLPPDAEVSRRVEEQIDRVRAGFADEAAFQLALSQQGLTAAAYREQLRSQIRAGLIRETFMRRRLQSAAPAVVTEAEMQAFFEEHRDELQQRPELLTVRQVAVRSGAADAAWDRALELADSLRERIRRGDDFEELAREHSQDPGGSGDEGGDLGWIQRGGTVPEFDQAAFSLPDGAVSPPIRTEFGYHIIKVERSRPGEKRVRHILIRPDIEPADLERARAVAEDVAQRIRGGVDALTLAGEHGDRDIPREFTVARGQESDIPPLYLEHLADAEQGDVIGPFQVEMLRRTYFAVLHVTQVREAGQFTFEDVRDTIRQLLTQEKRQEQLYRELRERTYVEIRP